MGHQLARNPRDVLHRHHVALRGRPEAPGVEALEGTPRFAQPNHSPSGFRRQNAAATPASASPDLGQVGTNLRCHTNYRIPLMINIKQGCWRMARLSRASSARTRSMERRVASKPSSRAGMARWRMMPCGSCGLYGFVRSPKEEKACGREFGEPQEAKKAAIWCGATWGHSVGEEVESGIILCFHTTP